MAAIRTFTKTLFEVCAQKDFWLKVLGVIDEYEIWLVRTREIYSFDHKDPRILVAAGFHGEEVAGPWAILKWLQACDEKYLKSAVDVSLVPIVNPWGFAKGKRYGPSEIMTNYGFCHQDKDNAKPSPEGEALIKNIELLRPLAQDGFLSLHEDINIKEYYLYTFEHGKKPGKFTKSLKRELSKHFPKSYDGIAYVDSRARADGPVCKNGLVYKFCDGSFEDWMFHLGVPKVAVTETPGKYRLKRRTNAGVEIINKFIGLSLETKGGR